MGNGRTSPRERSVARFSTAPVFHDVHASCNTSGRDPQPSRVRAHLVVSVALVQALDDLLIARALIARVSAALVVHLAALVSARRALHTTRIVAFALRDHLGITPAGSTIIAAEPKGVPWLFETCC